MLIRSATLGFAEVTKATPSIVAARTFGGVMARSAADALITVCAAARLPAAAAAQITAPVDQVRAVPDVTCADPKCLIAAFASSGNLRDCAAPPRHRAVLGGAGVPRSGESHIRAQVALATGLRPCAFGWQASDGPARRDGTRVASMG